MVCIEANVLSKRFVCYMFVRDSDWVLYIINVWTFSQDEIEPDLAWDTANNGDDEAEDEESVQPVQLKGM